MIFGIAAVKQLVSLARLSPLQHKILEAVSNTNLNASQFVRTLGIPLSTAWHNLRQLRDRKLVAFGEAEPIRLTSAGRLITEAGDGEEPTIGIAGGFGPETTAKFLTKLLDLSRKQLGRRPKVALTCAAVPDDVETAAITHSIDLLQPFVEEGIGQLASAGASFIVIPSNTLSLLVPKLREKLDIHVISLVEEVVKVIRNRRFSRVGLLATTMLLNSKLFQKALSNDNVDLLLPTEREQTRVMAALERVLSSGSSGGEERAAVEKVMNSLRRRGAQIIILACTDFQLMVDTSKADVLDTLDILAEATIGELKSRGSATVERPAVKALLSAMQDAKALAEKPSASGLGTRKVACANQARGTIVFGGAHQLRLRRPPAGNHHEAARLIKSD